MKELKLWPGDWNTCIAFLIVLRGCGIGMEGVKALAEALVDVLIDLNLSYNVMGLVLNEIPQVKHFTFTNEETQREELRTLSLDLSWNMLERNMVMVLNCFVSSRN